ncbi:MAG: type IV pilin protein [Candidatus Binatia bacterium]
MNRLRLRADGGFTLIELLVVIAIIGILAAIAIPQFAAYRRRGYEADAQSAVRNLATSQEAYYAQTQSYKSGAGNSLASYGFNQKSDISITTQGFNAAGGGTFLITGTSTKCTNGPHYTYSSSTGTIALANSCT